MLHLLLAGECIHCFAFFYKRDYILPHVHINLIIYVGTEHMVIYLLLIILPNIYLFCCLNCSSCDY